PPPPPRSTLFPYTTLFRSSDDRAAVFPLVGVVKKFLLRHARSTTTIWRQQPVPSIVEVIDKRLHTVSDVSQRLVGMDWLLILWRDRKSTRLNSSHVAISYA